MGKNRGCSSGGIPEVVGPDNEETRMRGGDPGIEVTPHLQITETTTTITDRKVKVDVLD